jgi:hypothetical protein
MLSTEDRVEILQLTNLYGHVVDGRLWDRLPEIFTEDAVNDLTDMGLPSMKGLPAIRAHLDQKHEFEGVHILTNTLIEEIDGEVFVTSRPLIPNPEGKVSVAVVRDVVVKTPKGWRVAHRHSGGLLRPGPELPRKSTLNKS